MSVLKREGYQIKTGMDAILYGNIPGGGMSRSASLSLNLIESILQLNGYHGVSGMGIVNLAQMVEVDYIGSLWEVRSSHDLFCQSGDGHILQSSK